MTQIEIVELPDGVDGKVVEFECPTDPQFGVKFAGKYSVVTMTPQGEIMGVLASGSSHRWKPSRPCRLVGSENGVTVFSTVPEKDGDRLLKALTSSMIGMLHTQKQIMAAIGEIKEALANLSAEQQLREDAAQKGSS